MKQFHSFEQRELDAIRYNTDGRCFRLEIENEILRLNSTYSWTINGAMMKYFIFLLSTEMIVFWFFPHITLLEMLWCVPLATLIFCFVLTKLFSSRTGIKWVFNRANNSLEINPKEFARLDEVTGIVALNKTKHRFLLAVDFKDGRRLFIGNWCFSTKEFSWREDAQTIANFLNVPLYIPEV